MNQRTIKVLNISTGAQYTGALLTGGVFDLAVDTVTTGAWAYANVGRREMKFGGYLVNAFTGTSNVTAATGWLLSATSGGATAWTPVANSTWGGNVTNNAGNFTTAGGFWPIPEMHFYTNDRYIRPVINIQGATTASVSAALFVLIEQRAS